MTNSSFKLLGSAAALSLAMLASAGGSVLLNLPAAPKLNANTVPANGDVNPYGVAFVGPTMGTGGKLHTGNVLVANFNNGANLQGTGTTIVQITPAGKTQMFFQSPAAGLDTALGVLKGGFVIVGNLPTTDGTFSTVGQGSLQVIDRFGKLVATLSDPALLDGPWDLTVHEDGIFAQIFVSNVLSGTVTRIDALVGISFLVLDMVQIASGYGHRPDPAALVVGPTGLAYDDANDILYVASTDDNAVYGISNAESRSSDAGVGTLVYSDNAHLRGPLGLVLEPEGNLITANGDAVNSDPTQPSEMVEFTPSGSFIDQVSVDTGGQGGAFGLAITGNRNRVQLAAVDDVLNTLKVWNVHTAAP